MSTRMIFGLMPSYKAPWSHVVYVLLLLVLASSLIACAGSTSTTTPAATPPLTPNTAPAATPTAPLVMIADPTPTPTPPPTGNTAPDFVGVDVVTNETISLSEFKESTVLLNFVNYGCSRSLNEIVSAQLLAIKDLREQRDDFTAISIFCGCCSPDVLRQFAEQNDLTWPWILDNDNSIVREYVDYLREYGYPTLVLIDKDQYIREVAGYTDLSTLSTKIDGLSQY